MGRRASTFTSVGLCLGLISCSLDTDRAAPFSTSPTAPGPCGTTETLLPKLLLFVKEGRFAPLREVIERRLLPSEENPVPDPSMKTLLGALVALVGDLGLDRTAFVVDSIERGGVEEQLAPLAVTVFRFIDGQVGPRKHYEAGDAAALFVRSCNPAYLLKAVEQILRLESPSHHERWLLAILRELGPLVADPALTPFLDTFQREAERGRPAIISLLAQIMLLVSDEGFKADRIHTLLESAVYPIAPSSLRPRIDALVVLLDEALSPDAAVLVPLQGSLRCGLQHPAERDALIGLVFDLVATKEIGLDKIIDTTLAAIDQDRARAELDIFADLVRAVREDARVSGDVRALAATLLSRPDSEQVLPVLIELIDDGVAIELVQAMVTLLGGCGRDVGSM